VLCPRFQYRRRLRGYLQGGGGNTSVKLADGCMAIKASGYCLKDIRADKAYAVLDYEKLRHFYNNSAITDFQDVEATGSAKAKTAIVVIKGLGDLRPSVEAGFHALLDTYVIHSHSVYANFATCSKECQAIAEKALGDAEYTWGFVPYTDPGARLTFAIRDELTDVEASCQKRPDVILMANHGLIVHHDDPDMCLSIHKDVNNRFAAAFGVSDDSFPPVSLIPCDNGMYQTDIPYLADELQTGDFDDRVFLNAPLYPDQMVFLIGSFSVSGKMPDENRCTANIQTGNVIFRMPRAKAMVVAETLTAVVFIRRAIERKGFALSTMGEAAKGFIAGWESEQYRKSLADMAGK